MTGEAWSVTPTGLRVAVRLTPKGGRDAFDGIDALADGTIAVKARVRAAPENGEANAAILALLAEIAGIPRSRAVLVSGHTARLKTIDLAGDGAALAAKFTQALAAL
ncbi:DUF167 family protein [Flaviflagellibacter deserti]|uniref:UPF0235 protein ACFPFW_16590 n=1 Tax=Flaviflagellibacter deserti TaxID=2267266 RepID=A0ABV9Z4W4_9HYPH